MREAETTTCSISCAKALVAITEDSAITDDAASNLDLSIMNVPSASPLGAGWLCLSDRT
jgi:hypothetical protein